MGDLIQKGDQFVRVGNPRNRFGYCVQMTLLPGVNSLYQPVQFNVPMNCSLIGLKVNVFITSGGTTFLRNGVGDFFVSQSNGSATLVPLFRVKDGSWNLDVFAQDFNFEIVVPVSPSIPFVQVDYPTKLLRFSELNRMALTYQSRETIAAGELGVLFVQVLLEKD